MNLPEEIVVEILSRISIKNIIHCRRVCRIWHNIYNLRTLYYTNMHSSTSSLGLTVHAL